MINESEVDLKPTFNAMRDLRIAYSKHALSQPEICNAALRRFIGLLTSNVVRQLVDPALRGMNGTQPLLAVQRKRLLAKERELVSRVGGYRGDAIKRALSPAEAGPLPSWAQSVLDLAAHVEAVHEDLLADAVRAPLWSVKQRRRNKRALQRVDHAVLSVGFVLVDVLERPYMPLSYRIGAFLAAENDRFSIAAKLTGSVPVEVRLT